MPATRYAVTAGSLASLARRDKSNPAKRAIDKDIKICIKITPDENYEEIKGQWLTNNPYASIHRIAIKNTHHNKKIGVKMLLEAEKIVLNHNVTSIKIDTHNLNKPMTKTILNAGYTYCGIITLKRSNTDNLRDAYEKMLTK